MANKEKKTKKKSNVLFYIAFAIGILICLWFLIYPAVSNYFYGNIESHAVIKAYEEEVEKIDNEEKSSALEQANTFNAMLATGIITDQFDYSSLLNVSENGMMATIEIPRINVNLPIYHGDTTEALEKGAAHLVGSSMPVGGDSTHAVISAHTGMSGKEMFSDLEQLELGDVFYIKVLGDTLAYEVENIEVVEPWEMDRLHIIEGKDCVTLVTCTPYGINTHRLLVRGSRVPYEEAVVKQEAREKEAPPVTSNWTDDYKHSLLLGGAGAIGVLVLFLVIIPGIKKIRRRRLLALKRREEKDSEDGDDPDEGNP